MQKKLALQPRDIGTLKFLAATYNLAGDYPQAIHYINTILEINPDDVDAYDKLAGLYIKLESYDKAIDLMQKKRARRPDDIGTLKFLAEAYNRTGNYPQAIDTIDALLKLQPNVAEIYYYRAKNYHQLNDSPRALQNCLKALELDSEFLPARLSAADAYKKMGQLKEAVEHYEKALRQDPNLPFGHNSVAWIQATNKNPDLYNPPSALSHAQKAVELAADERSAAHSSYPYFLDTLAAAQSANGQFEAAIETAGLALKLCREKGLISVAEEIQKHLDLYKQHQTYRE